MKTWDLILSMADFAYNDYVNKITGLILFEVVTGFKSGQPIDLVPMTYHHSRVLDSASVFASHICALYEEIREKIMKNNVDYKIFADLHRRLMTSNVEDYVMIRLDPSGFLQEP